MWSALVLAIAAGIWAGSGFIRRAVLGAPRVAFGVDLDPAAAVGVTEALAETPADADGPLVVSGEVTEVCASSGCWLVLRDPEGGVAELFVDLARDASFTVPRDLVGERVAVTGVLEREGANLRFHGRGARRL